MTTTAVTIYLDMTADEYCKGEGDDKKVDRETTRSNKPQPILKWADVIKIESIGKNEYQKPCVLLTENCKK